MARRPNLGAGSLTPFSSGGLDFGAFNVVDPGQEAYLVFLKVQVEYNAGRATDDQYLAALEVYAKAQTPGTSDAISIAARLEETRYRVGRNILVASVENGEAELEDLIAFDKAGLTGLNTASEEYRSRLDQLRSSQAQWVSEQEKAIVERYSDGKLSTTQLRQWYTDLLSSDMVENNPDLIESLEDRVDELTDRTQDEQDSRMLSDFNDGRVTTTDFLAYAASARARYTTGSTQAQEWDDRIQKARESSTETALLYRYNLSQQYADLQRFVQSNAGKPSGGTSTSTSKRVVLGADGQWHTITSTSTKATAPSAAQVSAYKNLQVQIADAKRQMAEIAGKITGVGGFISTATVTGYYQKQLGTFAKGTAEWYRIQGKLDDLNDRAHAESVYSKQGIKITYPKGSGATSSGGGSGSGGGGQGAAAAPSMVGGGGISLDQFMRAIAKQESGGRYDARNKSSGAYGKYQIMPSNWSSWAQKAGLPANAPQTPENQERVARAAFMRLAKSYKNDWSRVAAAWFGGVAGEKNRGPRTQRYVAAIMAHLGTTQSAVAGGGGGASYGGGGGGGAGTAPAAPPKSKGAGGPLAIVVSTGTMRRGGEPTVQTQAVGFPTNLDSRLFERFYANYERAFESGQESFVDTSSGKAVHYYIGDDADERIDRMRQLDDLRVRLYDTRAVAYEGTASELTAVNQRNEAYKDTARHEYMILDTTSNGTLPGMKSVNPLASGIRVLDKQKAAIERNLAAAKAAFARGDLTAAYSLLQMAQHQASEQAGSVQSLAGYAAAIKARIAGIQQASGGIDPNEALGSEKGGTFSADLERLLNFDDELTGLFDADATGILTEIKSHVKLDGNGSPVFDDSGPKGQLVLKDDSYFKLGRDGKVTLESGEPTWDPTTRKSTFKQDGQVTVRVKSGASVIEAQAEYEVKAVGVFVDPNNPAVSYPIMGKVVQQRNADGTWTTFYENPMAPGSKKGWSNKPFIVQAPKGFKAVDDGSGNVIYTFQVFETGKGGTQAVGGWTYSLILDPKTGVYRVYGDKPGGWFSAAVEGEFIGTAGDAITSSLFGDAGFVRTGGSGSVFDGTDLPVFGMDGDEYEDWKADFQPPALAGYDKTFRFGGLSPKGLAGLFDLLPGKPYGGKSPDERDEDARGRSRGGTWGQPDFSFSPKGLAGLFDLLPKRTSGGQSPDERDEARRGLPPLPAHGGLSPDERDEAAARAQLPPKAAPRPVAPPPIRPGIDKGGAAPKPTPKPTVAASKARHTKPPPARKALPPPVKPPIYQPQKSRAL